jgi:hypothetical protein
MTWKQRLAVGAFAAGLGVGSQAARAEDPVPEKVDAAAAPTEAPKKKDPFFGDRFAMYLEVRYGPASIDTISNPLTSGSDSTSESTLGFDGNDFGQFTVGWTLPRDRGQYLLTYTGIADGDYELNATGSQRSYEVQNSQPPAQLQFLLPWWQVTIRDGQLTTTETPPVWDSRRVPQGGDDANSNGLPDLNEIRYPTTTVDLLATVPKDLGNRIQTWDLVYRREFGGLRIRSRWTAGVRYLNAEGAILTPSWLVGIVGTPGFGYSDGVVNNFIVMQQSTTGVGPVGSCEIQFNFFRQRLTLYGTVQAAFLLEKLDTDSGAFTYLARDPAVSGVYFPGSGRIQGSVSKTGWNPAFEMGLRVKLLEGFHLAVDWNRTGYLDTILIPTNLSIPTNASQIALGTTARFISRDFVVSTINLGLSFQF